MATTKKEIEGWLESAVHSGATHVIVVCDTYEYEDYSVLVMPNDDLFHKINLYDMKDMQKVMEVYDLRQPLEPQLNMVRAGLNLVERARKQRK